MLKNVLKILQGEENGNFTKNLLSQICRSLKKKDYLTRKRLKKIISVSDILNLESYSFQLPP